MFWSRLRKRRRSLEERVQGQIEAWQRDCPIEVLGGRPSELSGGKAGAAFVLLFWNNSGITCSAVAVRLSEVRAGPELEPLKALPPARGMPLKLLPAVALAQHREGARGRPLARMKLGPYERGEVELVEVDETDASLRIQHESGEAHFSLDADEYELVLELSADSCRELFTMGIRRLAKEGKWVASMPRSVRKLDRPLLKRGAH
jgi:hypothetical protein